MEWGMGLDLMPGEQQGNSNSGLFASRRASTGSPCQRKRLPLSTWGCKRTPGESSTPSQWPPGGSGGPRKSYFWKRNFSDPLPGLEPYSKWQNLKSASRESTPCLWRYGMEAKGVILQQGNSFLMQKFDTGPPCSKILLTWPRQTDTVFPLADQHTQHSATSHPRDREG